MAYDRAALEDALRNAHAAGDTAAATRLADALVEMSSMSPDARGANMAALRQLDSQQMDAAKYEGERTSNPFLTGVDVAAKRALKGVLDLPQSMFGAPSFSPEMLDRGLREAQAATAQQDSGWNTAGQVGMDIAMSAAPIAAATRLAQAPALAAKLGRLAPYAVPVADIAANAGYNAATTPEDRLEASVWGAGGAAAGRTAARVLGGVVRPSDSAKELMDQGVRLTPGQAGEGVMGAMAKTYEGALEAIPVLGRPMSWAREQGVKDFNRSVLDEAYRGPREAAKRGGSTANLDPNTPVGQQQLLALSETLSSEYQKAFPVGKVLRWGGDDAAAAKAGDDVSKVIGRQAERLPSTSAAEFQSNTDWLQRTLSEGVDASQYKEVVESALDAWMAAARRDGQNSLARAYKAVDDALTNTLQVVGGPTSVTKEALDMAWAKLRTIERAAAMPSALKRDTPGMVYPSELIGAIRSADPSRGKTLTAEGRPHLLQKALAGHAALGPPPGTTDQLKNLMRAAAVGGAGTTLPGAIALPGFAASYLGVTPAGRNLLLGRAEAPSVLRSRMPEWLQPYASQEGIRQLTPQPSILHRSVTSEQERDDAIQRTLRLADQYTPR